MTSLCLTVSVFGGQGVETACRDAADLAARVDIAVLFDFNEIHLVVQPGEDGTAARADYWRRLGLMVRARKAAQA